MLGRTLRKTVSGVAWVARGASMALGLAVVLALTAGVASTALAGTGLGATFNLGQTNAVNAISKLVGSVTGPSLQIDNNSTGTGATALDLQTEAGKAPMTVNSSTKVDNLNADSLDGKDSTGFVQSAKPIKMVAAAQVFSDGRVNPFANSNVAGVTKVGTGFYHVQVAGVASHNRLVAVATAAGSDGKVVNTSVVGSGTSSRITVAIKDRNGAFVDGGFSLVAYDPTS